MIEDTKRSLVKEKTQKGVSRLKEIRVIGSEEIAHLPLKGKQNSTAVFDHSDWNLLPLNCDFLSGEILL